MNEKTKRILSYVACGLGGLALGIALLGGLSYCSVSEKAEQNEINTILTKKNAVITTEGGYNGYSFSLETDFPTITDGYSYTIYGFEDNTYTPVTYSSSSGTLGGHNRSSVVTMINTAYEQARQYQVSNRTYHFLLAFFAFSNPWGPYTANNYPITYLTFVEPAYDGFINGYTNANTTFVLTSAVPWNITMSINSTSIASWGASAFYTLTNSRQSFFCFKHTENDTTNYTLVFQDVVSYYQESGYQDGYRDGETTGYNSGYADGFDDGSDNGLLFTDLGVNQLTWARSDMSWDSQTDTTATMKLFDFKDGENNSYYVSFTDYSLGGGFPTVEVYKNGTASNNIFARIASGTWNNAYTQLEIIPSTYLKFEFAQITTYYHNSIPNGWFTLTGIPANATGYEVGYQTGYREGYLASPGGQATENVFSLFTNAFDSVGGIFNLKIFGFLPLYWFFLTPIFIAIIALILRLVKH